MYVSQSENGQALISCELESDLTWGLWLLPASRLQLLAALIFLSHRACVLIYAEEIEGHRSMTFGNCHLLEKFYKLTRRAGVYTISKVGAWCSSGCVAVFKGRQGEK